MTRDPFRLCLLLWLAVALCRALAADEPAPSPEDVKFFEEKVRPVLANHCYKCHGPAKQQAGLRLDNRAGLLQGGDSGAAVVAGKPDESLLVEAVERQGDLKMPPDKPLPVEAVAALREWVKRGAPWPRENNVAAAPTSPEGIAAALRTHWAFQPVRRVPLPAVKQADWCDSPIDRFILAKLEAHSLSPAPPADRRTLLRRVTFDLIGFPPTPAESAEFEADASPDAFAKVVDRLLASPHYGERWGRYWLDVARYADSKGYVFFQDNNYPWSYTYRDYVVRALNSDLPYDQFVLQQLAADLLPADGDNRKLAALGFLTLGGRFMNNQHDILDDRIDVTTRGLMGLTVSCARCHDHKFDPIPTADYYSLYGVFASSIEPEVPPLIDAPPSTEEYRTFETELRKRETALLDFVKTKHDELVSKSRLRAGDYMLASYARRNQPKADEFMLLADGDDLNPKMLLRWERFLEKRRKKHDPVFALWDALAALPLPVYPEPTFTEQAYSELVRALVIERAAIADPARAVNPLVAKALLECPLYNTTEVARRFGELFNDIDREWQAQLQLTAAAGQPVPAGMPEESQEQIRRVFHSDDSPPKIVFNPYGDLDLLPDRPSQAKLQELRKAVESFRATGAGAPPRAMSLVDASQPQTPRIFLRGTPSNPGDVVPRQFLRAVSTEERKPFQQGSGRLEMARAIADPQNPLTARVVVNRLWLHHFGAGLVRTPGDFGLRSDPPSHPELLDHLAISLIDSGWSLKSLHRQILLSRVYQQSSELPVAQGAAGFAVDPENRWLWKMNRRRLDFEALRDSLLFAAGTLDERMTGAGQALTTAPYPQRRTIYGFIDRLNLPGLFRTFDFPSPDATSSQRDATTVPPQSLFLMNNPFVLETARNLAARSASAMPGWEQRVQQLYQLLYCRHAVAEELDVARAFFGAPETTPPTPADWERYAQALLLSNEFAFVD